ncbi:MAG: histidine phosphatase family protein [Chloroflexi bacterium]|nr:histidine phosphatase family protein [Chloroflexota bacterium]
MTTRLLLARHGAIDWTGQIGAPEDGLSPLGRRQAEALARRLAGQEVAALYSSTLRRAAETAEIVAGQLGLDVRWEARLCEWDPGDWMGLPEAEVKAQQPDLWEQIMGDLNYPMPGGETFNGLRDRVSAAAREIGGGHPGQSVLLVSHGGALRALISGLIGLDLAALPWYPRDMGPLVIDYCSLSLVELRNTAPYLLCLNDTSHLERLT